MATVVLIGTLDTKGHEYSFLRSRILESDDIDVIMVDVGVLNDPLVSAEISREEVASAAGTSIADLQATGDRGRAISAMAAGARALVQSLFEDGRLHGILGLGGSGGSSLIAEAIRDLPVGVPKLIVSTVASGDTRPYVGAKDVTLMYSVVDIAGINRVSTQILGNAAAAVAAMARAYADRSARTYEEDKSLIGATMFGVTTQAVTTARELLESRGYEVLVFHATGTGGQSMEALIDGGFLAGVLDLTTTELADELVGGVFSAGPDRLERAGAAGIPQVVSLGALDMVNFGAMTTVPHQFRDRNLYVHNPTVTLMRTTPEECRALGQEIATKLNAATGPTAVFIPRRGVSAIAVEGAPFFDPEADRALFGALREGVDERVEVHDLDLAINDPQFAEAMALRLIELIEEVPSSV